MKVKLFVEPREKAREDVLLESTVPLDMKLFKQWQKTWISNKEFKKWMKDKWPTDVLGELRQGKILTSALRDPGEDMSLKGSLFAYRSFVAASTGAKIKLPMVLFAQIKKTIGLEYFQSTMNLDAEQESFVKDALKDDPWAPISVWHPQPVDRRHEIAVSDVLPHAIKYAKALFEQNLKEGNWSAFSETEQFK
ncbi:MAG: hypothetical protein E4H14_05935 [Candidatus Thorarchaeota archaeon]|nr:MAG: hypothetical protein E4H14_05935 [Candidatus Thorarchaeota archaeon]